MQAEAALLARASPQGAAVEPDALAHPDQAEPAGLLALLGSVVLAVVNHVDLERRRLVVQPHRRPGPTRVLESVRQRLLDDAIGGELERTREAAPLSVDDELDGEPSLNGVRDQLVEPCQVGARRQLVGLVGAAEEAEQAVQLVDRLATRGLDRAQDLLRLLGPAAHHAARSPGLDPDDADVVSDGVGLADAAERRIKDFSLGMRQRLALAAALLGDPDVLILDEPGNGLDPEGVHWLRCFLRSFADRGGTVLVSSHLLAEVAHTVDDVVIIAHGRLVTQSSLTELAERRPSGVRVRTPQAETLRSALSDQGIAADLLGPETLVAFDTTAETVGLAAAGVGAAIYEMTTQHLDLEEMFLELTNHEEAIR